MFKDRQRIIDLKYLAKSTILIFDIQTEPL